MENFYIGQELGNLIVEEIFETEIVVFDVMTISHSYMSIEEAIEHL